MVGRLVGWLVGWLVVGWLGFYNFLKGQILSEHLLFHESEQKSFVFKILQPAKLCTCMSMFFRTLPLFNSSDSKIKGKFLKNLKNEILDLNKAFDTIKESVFKCTDKLYKNSNI